MLWTFYVVERFKGLAFEELGSEVFKGPVVSNWLMKSNRGSSKVLAPWHLDM